MQFGFVIFSWNQKCPDVDDGSGAARSATITNIADATAIGVGSSIAHLDAT
jgi:hypothetical protein